jgi:hypothetical protein
MEGFIISETNKIFSKAILRFSKKESQDPLQASILLCLSNDEERNVVYKICFEHQVVRECSIMDILGVSIDFKGYSMLVPPQIKKILENFSQELNSTNVEVMVYLGREDENDDEDENEVIYFLYDAKRKVKRFKLSEVLKLQIA